LDEFWVEGDFERDFKTVVKSQYQDEEVPVSLERMVHRDHQMRFLACNILLLLDVLVGAIG
jgi:hypothetical protein